jgi:hypothetical protein
MRALERLDLKIEREDFRNCGPDNCSELIADFRTAQIKIEKSKFEIFQKLLSAVANNSHNWSAPAR